MITLNEDVASELVGFGKYATWTLQELLQGNRGYFAWAVENVDGFAERLDMARKGESKAARAERLEDERAFHAKYVSGHPLHVLMAMRKDLKNSPPSDEWYTKRWWRLRRDAVEERLEDCQQDQLAVGNT